MATDVDSQIAPLRRVLVNLLDQLQRDDRCMTPRERQRYSTGVRLLARCSGRPIKEVITSLTAADRDRAATTGLGCSAVEAKFLCNPITESARPVRRNH